ncbi:MFS transporter [Nocardioides bizhenqiangii]|uniref:MFS transporter n=2 Tax=Nocardioides bizhenqiangii TaxID=3095076 RepID=A0ABZ0ZP85_9ACTN|nr:MFS transporter [Nocardioides sp. HM61]WQQ26150.1 MFS transporter [Nocardioides sp. HM61]
MTEPTSTTQRAGRREWCGLAVIALACVLYVMDLTVLHLAVPALSADLQPSSTQMLWIIDIYGFMIAGSLITMGSLGDRIGRRRLLLIGAAAFGVTSVLAAFSTSPEMLIVTRALLGVSGATLAPSTLSLIRSMFHDPRQRTTAIGIWITSFSAGAAIGPVLGGVVLEYFWWGAVFLLNVPVMIALLVLGPRLLPEYRDPDAGRADLPSAALSLAAMLALVYGLKRVAQDGMTATAVVTALAGVGLAFVFVRRQRRLTDPLIDLSLFRIPAFSAALATYGIGIFVLFGGFLFIPQYLQLVLGMTPLEAGLWTLPWALSFVVGSNVTPILARRIDPTWLMGGGLLLAAVGFALLLGIEPGSGLPLIVLGSIGFSLGMSPVFTLTNDLIIGSAPPERAGAAAGVSETAAEVGGALGIAVLGSIGVAVYRRDVEDALPGTLASEQDAAARGTLGGAVEVAEGLPAASGEALMNAAEAAFTTGVHLGALIAAVSSLALAGFVLSRGRVGVLTEEPEPVEEPVDVAVDEPVACGDGCRP